MKPNALVSTAFGVLLITAALACSSPIADSASQRDELPLQRDSSPVRTDSVEYNLRKVSGGYEAIARMVYVNGTGADVFFRRCMPDATGPMFYVQRAESDTSRSFVGAAWACVGGVPTGRLSFGDSLVFAVWLGSTDSPNANPPVTMPMRTGTFRVLLALCRAYSSDSDFCDSVPIEQRRSNLFRVNAPR